MHIEVQLKLAFDINDGKGLVYVAPSHNAAGGHDAARAALVLLDMEADHAVLCRHLGHLLVVNCTKMLNEDGPSLQKSPEFDSLLICIEHQNQEDFDKAMRALRHVNPSRQSST